MTRISLDIGYRHPKMYQIGQQPVAFDSVYADLVSKSRPTVNAQSAIIEYTKANHVINQKLVGKIWIAGSSARNKNIYKATMNYEKSEVAIRLGLLAFKPKNGQPFVDIDCLATSLPELRDQTAVENMKQAFLGEHKYKRNSEEIRLNIREVKIYPEGLGTFWLANHQGLTIPDTLTGVCDLGGKTCNLVLIDEYGEPIEDASSSFKVGGTYHLASLLAADPRLVNANKGDAPKLETLMNALQSGSTFYGTTGVSFADYYNDYLEQWFSGILSEVETRWQRYFDRLGRVILTGGSANLVKDLIADNDYFVIPANPQFCNVMGLLHPPRPAQAQLELVETA
ncbi:MAG: ParM/StbA family protein [Microcoleaceae cyanobacterium]